jgi:hypothetical protein
MFSWSAELLMSVVRAFGASERCKDNSSQQKDHRHRPFHSITQATVRRLCGGLEISAR